MSSIITEHNSVCDEALACYVAEALPDAAAEEFMRCAALGRPFMLGERARMVLRHHGLVRMCSTGRSFARYRLTHFGRMVLKELTAEN